MLFLTSELFMECCLHERCFFVSFFCYQNYFSSSGLVQTAIHLDLYQLRSETNDVCLSDARLRLSLKWNHRSKVGVALVTSEDFPSRWVDVGNSTSNLNTVIYAERVFIPNASLSFSKWVIFIKLYTTTPSSQHRVLIVAFLFGSQGFIVSQMHCNALQCVIL